MSSRNSAFLWAALALLVILASAASAQEAPAGGRIAGQVVDAEGGRPLAGSRVVIAGVAGALSADVDGRYRTGTLPAGKYSLRVSAIGYQTVLFDSVLVTSGGTTLQNAALRAAAVELQELVAQAPDAQKESSAAGLLALQQAAPVVSDGISAEQIARSADGDAAEAVARISGVSVADNKVIVRGLAERYSTTTLNGTELPSPDPNKKVVPLDLFPSALLDAIVATKSATPDRPGDFAGGSVDVRTKEFPERRVLALSFSGGYNSIATGDQLALPSLSGSAWLGSADESRSLPPLAPPPLDGPADAPGTIFYFQNMRNLFEPSAQTAPPEMSASLTYGDQLSSGTLGWIVSARYALGYEGQLDRVFRFYRYPDLASEPTGASSSRFNEAVQNVEVGLIANLTARLGSFGKLGFKNFLTQSGRDYASFNQGFDNETNVQGFESYQVKYTSRSLRQHQLAGDHILGFFRGSRLEWRGTYAKAIEDEPDNRVAIFGAEQAPSGTGLVFATQPLRPRNWFARTLEDDFLTGQLDLSVPFRLRRPDDFIVKLGGYYRTRDRSFDNLGFQVDIEPGTPLEFRRRPFEEQFADENIGVLVRANRVSTSGLGYSMTESIPAAYAMLDVEALPGLRLTGGLRYEKWDFDLGFVTDNGEPPTDPVFAQRIIRENDDLLWSGNVTWALGSRTNVRAAGFRSVARPDGRELAPIFYIPVSGECSATGNRTLRRTSIYNGELRFEHYPNAGEILAAGFFYKSFDEPIVEFIGTEVGGGTRCQVQPGNAVAASNLGFELEVRKNLGFVSRALSSFSVSANYAYVNSETELAPAYDAEDFRPPLTLQSPHVVNAALNWTTPGGSLSANALVNYFSDRIVRYGAITPVVDGLLIVPSVVEQGRLTVDARVNWKLGSQWQLSFIGQNLTDQNVRLVQELDEGEVVVGSAQLGLRLSVGASYAIY